MGASCFHTLSEDSRDLDKDTWDKERFGQVCTQPQNFIDLKSNLEKLCYKNKKCTYQQKKILKKITRDLEKFNKDSNDLKSYLASP